MMSGRHVNESQEIEMTNQGCRVGKAKRAHQLVSRSHRGGHGASAPLPRLLLRTASVVMASLFLVAQGAVAEGLTPPQQLAYDIYKELVEIDTTTATGDTALAALAMAARLKAGGFTDADVHVFSPAPHKGNLVARLKGSGARKPILLVAHLDVVPAKREDWSDDAFKLTEKDG